MICKLTGTKALYPCAPECHLYGECCAIYKEEYPNYKSDEDGRIISEFDFDKESANRIEDIVHKYPISLKDCADILQSVVPLLERVPGRDIAKMVYKWAADSFK